MAQYLDSIDLRGKSVVELGAGLGLPGMVAHMLGASSVVLTDKANLTDLLRHNVEKNFTSSSVRVHTLDWSSEQDRQSIARPIDLILCCDCIYEPLYGKSWKPLAATVRALADPHTRVIIVVERRNADGVDSFLQCIQSDFEVASQSRGKLQLFELTKIAE